MLRDKHGISYGLEDPCQIKEFVSDSEEYFDELLNNIPWEKMEWRRGKYLPRLVYRYDRDLDRKSIDVLEELKFLLEEVLETDIHGVWCNLYSTGEMYTPWHQDSYDTHVYTLSFGATRKFSVRKRGDAKTRVDYSLGSGDLFYFSPEFNSGHEHTVPKTTRVKEPRVSIVFFGDRPDSRRGACKRAVYTPKNMQIIRSGILLNIPSDNPVLQEILMDISNGRIPPGVEFGVFDGVLYVFFRE